MRQLPAVILPLMFLAAVPLRAQPAPDAAPADAAAETTRRMAAVLQDSGLQWLAGQNSTWTTSFQGTTQQVVTVYVSVVGDLAVVQAPIAAPSSLPADRIADLLTLNFSLDLVKVSLQKDELIALDEAELRLLDGAGLKRIVESVAGCADDVATRLADPGTRPSEPPTVPQRSSQPASPTVLVAMAVDGRR